MTTNDQITALHDIMLSPGMF